MARKSADLERTSTRKVQTGDYIMHETPNGDTIVGEKMLVNIGDQRKSWIRKVVGLVPDSNMTEVLRCVLDQAMTEDPESYASRVQKWRLKTQLEDIERRERELQEEKQRLVNSLESNRGQVPAA